jgi:hypothetical protein
MGGGSMSIELDEARGQAVGSRIRLAGSILGVRLSVESEVVVREPPLRKRWVTVGEPRLLVVGRYEMGFEIAPEADGSRLAVSIRYSSPTGTLGRLLAAALGQAYANWCTRLMAEDAQTHFGGDIRPGLQATPAQSAR